MSNVITGGALLGAVMALVLVAWTWIRGMIGLGGTS